MRVKRSPLHIEVYTTINDIPKEIWDGLFNPEIIENYYYQKTLEESHLKEFTFYYFIAKRNEKIVAIIPAFTSDFSFSTIIQGKLQKFILNVQKFLPRFLKIKILFIGSPTTEELYIGLPEEENLEKILDKTLKKIFTFARKKKASAVLFYNLTRKQQELADYLLRKGFAKMESFPNTVLKINTASIEEFFDSLGKSTRKSLKRKLSKTLELTELRTEISDDIGFIKDRIHELYLTNFTESDVRFETLTKEFFQNICINMPGIAKYFLTYDNTRLVAFNLLIIKNDTAIDKFIGFDTEVSRKYNLYYTTFIHNINYCIKNNIHYYQMGITDYEPKIRLGAALVPLYIYVRLLSPILNFIGKFFIKSLEPKRFDPTLKNLEY